MTNERRLRRRRYLVRHVRSVNKIPFRNARPTPLTTPDDQSGTTNLIPHANFTDPVLGDLSKLFSHLNL